MNGRLYDPLLRRFLNADENIQDPNNTQNYNKYGYVMNNPLMYNDPSGELFWFAFLAVALKSVFWGAVVAGAIGGAIIGSALYLGQAAFTGNFSWGGFAKSFFVGALTGAVAGGLGQVFSSSGFWATVGNGALAGAGGGGVTSLINGTNFLEGVLKGAVIGGAIGAVSYSIKYLVNGSYKAKYTTANDLPGSKDYGYDPAISNETMQNNIDKMRSDNFSQAEISEFGVGKDSLGSVGYDGYLFPDAQGDKILGYTGKMNFWTGKSDILYSARAAQNNILLGKIMVHETAHAYGNKLFSLRLDTTKSKSGYNLNFDPRLNTTEHIAIYKLEHLYAMKNGVFNIRNISGVYLEDINFTVNTLTTFQQKLINEAYNKFMPIFNRMMKY